MAGAALARAVATEMLVPDHFTVAPANGRDVRIAVAIEVHRECAIVVFIAGVNQVFTPAVASAIEILEYQQARRFRIFEIMFSGHDIEVAIGIHVGHVETHRSNHRPD